MAVYRFRVSFEDYEDISREIEIRSDQTFLDLHQTIQTSIQFDGEKPSSFFMSNDLWIKGKEIASHPKTGKNGEKIPEMSNSKLSGFIADPHQKIYYSVDPANPWTFHIELVKILKEIDAKIALPRVSKVSGDAPKQFLNPIPPPDGGEEDLAALDEPVNETEPVVEGIDEDELKDGMEEETPEGEDEPEEFGDVELSGEGEEEA